MTIRITRDQLENKCAELVRNGIKLTGDAGEIRAQGCVIAYSYDGTELTLDIKSKPILMPRALIENRLRSFLSP